MRSSPPTNTGQIDASLGLSSVVEMLRFGSVMSLALSDCMTMPWPSTPWPSGIFAEAAPTSVTA